MIVEVWKLVEPLPTAGKKKEKNFKSKTIQNTERQRMLKNVDAPLLTKAVTVVKITMSLLILVISSNGHFDSNYVDCISPPAK